jgi:predicted lipoprotein with Yx(FWY)xxD motif
VKRKSRYVIAAVGVAVLAAATTAFAMTAPPSQVRSKKTAALGTILVDGKGHTLYLFMKDKRDKSLCSGACAVNWPPYLTTGKPKAGPGVKATWLRTIKRTNGKLQVTYNHHPLYLFKYDKAAGQTKGENINAFGADWYVVSAAKGIKVEPADDNGGGNPPPPPPPGSPPPPPPPPPPPYP